MTRQDIMDAWEAWGHGNIIDFIANQVDAALDEAWKAIAEKRCPQEIKDGCTRCSVQTVRSLKVNP